MVRQGVRGQADRLDFWSRNRSGRDRIGPRLYHPNMDAVIVGAGHAGLATSHQLAQRGVRHVVLERARIGDSWTNRRWDSFALNTPTWMNVMPGDDEVDLLPPQDGFLSHHQWVDRLRAYVARWELPVSEGVTVTAIERAANGSFRVHTSGGDDALIECSAVIVASGIQNVTRLPAISSSFPDTVEQIPALEYKHPEQLPDGATLVVGAGQTGGQIVEELLASGRTTYWSLSAVTRMPRRHRGRDILEWLVDGGFFEVPTESIADPAMIRATMPIISGVGRLGHTLSLQWLESRGARLLGRVTAVDGDVLTIDDSVADCIAFGDKRSHDVCAQIDGSVLAARGTLPPLEPDEANEPHPDPASEHSPHRLDLAEAGVTSVIWATGVSGDFSYLPDEAKSDDGMPLHDRGTSPVAGIEYVGLPWQSRRGSGIIHGIVIDAGTAAERVARQIGA